MSKYTTQVRYICENASGLSESKGYNSVDEVIAGAIPKIFDFDFPIWDENYRNVLCTKILKHYYMREICAETVGLWKLFLSRRLQEIMPYYNKLYESTTLKFDPLMDVNYQREYDRTGTEIRDSSGNSNRNSTETTETQADGSSSGTNRDLFSDTPQGGLENVDNETYLTTARKLIDNTTDTQSNSSDRTGSDNSTYEDNTDIDTTEKYIEKITGKTAGRSYAKMIMEYRNTLIDIDMMVIDRLFDLFMLIW